MNREISKLFKSNLNSVWKSNSQELLNGIVEFDTKFISMRPESFTAKSMRVFFSTYVEQELASSFTTLVMGLYKEYREQNLSDSDIFLIFNDSKNEDNDNIEYIDKLNVAIIRLLKSHNMAFILKGSKLYYEINEVPDIIEIVTEIRPIFSDDANKMQAFIIRNVLHLKTNKYLNIEEHEFSLSKEQLQDLQKKCERAIRKIETARKNLTEISENGVAIFGENYED